MDANGGWDATETTWKNPCTTDRMNQWTNETWIKMIELVNRGINESQKRFSESMHQPKNRWISEPLNESRWTSESVNQWNVKNSMTHWTSDRTNKWIDEWMDGWMDGWMSYILLRCAYLLLHSAATVPLVSATSPLSSLLSGLLLWPCLTASYPNHQKPAYNAFSNLQLQSRLPRASQHHWTLCPAQPCQ